MAAFVIFTPMTILTYIAVSWFIVNFEPFQLLSRFNYSIDLSLILFLCMYIHSAFSCSKCVSFWLTLICTWDFILATIVALTIVYITGMFEQADHVTNTDQIAIFT
jgi:hypothetical protein